MLADFESGHGDRRYRGAGGKADASPALTQSLVDSNKVIDDPYIYLEDTDGGGAHLLARFRRRPRPEQGGDRRTTEAGEGRPRARWCWSSRRSRKTLSAMDVAAPISGGALGVVHGMNRASSTPGHTLRGRILAGRGAALAGIAAALFLVLVVVVADPGQPDLDIVSRATSPRPSRSPRRTRSASWRPPSLNGGGCGRSAGAQESTIWPARWST